MKHDIKEPLHQTTRIPTEPRLVPPRSTAAMELCKRRVGPSKFSADKYPIMVLIDSVLTRRDTLRNPKRFISLIMTYNR